MDMHTEFHSRGVPYCTATLYIYCDQCGSFDLRRYLPARRWLCILAACAAAIAGGVSLVRSGGYIHWIILGLVGAVLIFRLLWKAPGYRCQRCRSITSVKYNTLNYTSGTCLADVPEDRVQKRYMSGWPDLEDLDDVLRPPSRAPAQRSRQGQSDHFAQSLVTILSVPLVMIYVSLMPVIILVGLIINELFPGPSSRSDRAGKDDD